MKKQFTCLTLILSVAVASPAFGGGRDLFLLANPLQGTDSRDGFSHGNTYPEIALPFPENTWSPYTKPQPQSAFYEYADNKFYGIRQTHEPSIWIRDHASFAFMPVSGDLAVTEKARASGFEHEHEIAQPSYYKVDLDTWNVTAEVTPTERAARFRFTFHQPKNASYLVLDVFEADKPCYIRILPSENKVIGVARDNSGVVPDNFGSYFVIVFDRPFKTYGVWSDDGIQAGVTNLEGKHVGAFLQFNTSAKKVVECKVASSYISPEQAALNLQQEIGKADFDTIRHRATDVWNKALGRVQIQGGSEEQQRTFYSGLYRSILFPHRFYDYDKNHQPIHYSPYDGKVHPGVLYTDSGFWDTFRAAHPLYNLLYPEISAEILQSLITSYNESGWLPSWSSPGHREVMIGNHAFSLLADGWVKGVRSFDLQAAVNAVEHDAHHSGFWGMGREPVYDQLGYVPYPEVGAGTSQTLEFAYDDFCGAVLAQAAGRTPERDGFLKSAMNYTNVYDPKTGFMRARNKDGSWVEPFDPIEWGGAFTEGNAWQWTWSVMHDVPGLIRLMGGDKAFTDKLDAMFNAGSEVKVGSYHYMIHEMNEMVAQNIGQYAHGNEPIHHVIYLYDYAGQPWKTQARIRQIMAMLYQSTPDGLSGDEDTGQMSAWYVFSALGFYPVCPGSDVYAIGSPIFDKATLTVGTNRQFIIVAQNNGPQRPYIRAASLNDKPLDRVFLRHGEIVSGGEVKFEMDSMPDYHWAVGENARPPSLLPQLIEH
jgi:predicted alpha-1,2-mannosidase